MIVFGIILILLPVDFLSLSGLVIAGLGCAPIYPLIIHATPANSTRALAGRHRRNAAAYVGSTFMPPLFGFLAGKVGIGLFPLYLAVFAGMMIITSEALNRKLTQNCR